MKNKNALSRISRNMVAGILASTFLSPTLGLADSFDERDSNRDGVLSGQELAEFKLLDRDQDGEVTRQEFSDAATEQRERGAELVGKIFTNRDGNQDGKLSGNERNGLEHCDANNDRKITEEELRSGLTEADATLVDKSIEDLQSSAEERFGKLDITEDGRLTGNEVQSCLHYDQTGDGRVTKVEYFVGLALSLESGESLPDGRPMPEGGNEKIIAEFVKLMNSPEQAEVLRKRMHENLRKAIDPVLLQYALQHAINSHGNLSIPDLESIEQSKLKTGETQIAADLLCGTGDLRLTIAVLNGKITGFLMESPQILQLDAALFQDLQDDEWQNRFAKAYGTQVEAAIKLIVDEKDSKAIQMIHPSVLEQIGEQPFLDLFEKLRSSIGEFESAELESFTTERSETGVYSFTVTYLVTGELGSLNFSTKFQRDGLTAAMTGYLLDSSDVDLKKKTKDLDDSEEVTPAPKSDDDSPAPAPVMPSDDDDGELKWLDTVSGKDGISFKLPGKASRSEVEGEKGTITLYSLNLPKKKMNFVVRIGAMESDVTEYGDVFFTSFKKSLFKNDSAKILKETLDVNRKFPEWNVIVQEADGSYSARRYILAGEALYTFIWSGPDVGEASRSYAVPFLVSATLIDADGSKRLGFEDAKADANSENEGAPAPPTPAPIVDDSSLPAPPMPIK